MDSGAAFRVLGRRSTNVDARHGSGKADLDVPGLLQAHFPQHGPYLGVYARVIHGGRVRVGDTLVLSDAPKSAPRIRWRWAAAERRADQLAAVLANGLSERVRLLALAATGVLLAAAAAAAIYHGVRL